MLHHRNVTWSRLMPHAKSLNLVPAAEMCLSMVGNVGTPSRALGIRPTVMSKDLCNIYNKTKIIWYV